ncbi:unnamed protein product [Brassica oleracea]|uniref:(rape) hypothetical protein n=1 Tax=Brassica napus TaxID=3708 RepID=A0A816IHX6_BRANA|nr:unnamed protein product [Brassica napus]
MGVILISTGPSALAGTGSKGGALIGLELSTNRLNSNPEIAKEVNALEEVTKAGSHWYLDKIPVYDNYDQAVFILLGDAGRELTGKHASGLVDKYFIKPL